MAETDETAKSPDQKFWMNCKKDKIGNFERGCSQSNHRKVTDFGLLQDFKRMIMTFGSRVDGVKGKTKTGKTHFRNGCLITRKHIHPKMFRF